jgi:hypothetical protein
MKNRKTFFQLTKYFFFEFIVVFFGVLFAFWIDGWKDHKRNQEYVNHIVQNLINDLRNDSIKIADAIYNIKRQHDSLSILISNLEYRNYKTASKHIFWAYSTYNVFDPSTETYQSMIFGGDIKLMNDFETIREIKELSQINSKLVEVHSRYYNAVEAFRNNFICQHNIEEFDFESVKNKNEFWNRINFLKSNIKYYLDALLMAQTKYNKFLHHIRKK